MVTSSAGEWLVTDGLGGFAMGTRTGERTRKYHGFYSGIPGRIHASLLTDLEIEWDGQNLWPHRYCAGEGEIAHPEPSGSFSENRRQPVWRWERAGASLIFSVSSARGQGIRLSFEGTSGTRLRVRPFCAMRELHSIGGHLWSWSELPGELLRIASPDLPSIAWTLRLEGAWNLAPNPEWYQGFHYAAEAERGYPAAEDLFSAGWLSVDFSRSNGRASLLLLNPRGQGAEIPERARRLAAPGVHSPGAHGEDAPWRDFVLDRPAGIVAGYPWFGEWGRDTFISLPGILYAWIGVEPGSTRGLEWAGELLQRWGRFIQTEGMLPNLIESRGELQWESADATLWYTHAIASIWASSLVQPAFEKLVGLGLEPLQAAIESIRSGRHRFLRLEENGLLSVTGEHSTWMDARIAGRAVTPRLGALAEINALWVQACALHILASERSRTSPRLSSRWAEVLRLADAALECREPERPNRVFLHSLPLAPSFLLASNRSLEPPELERDLARWQKDLLTPVGLRSLGASSPGFQGRYEGAQDQRDQAYHQGPIWAWLAGHYLMALARKPRSGWRTEARAMEQELRGRAIVEGHIPEIFDGSPPYHPRGAPAQAWSLSCLEEFRGRIRMHLDHEILKRIS